MQGRRFHRLRLSGLWGNRDFVKLWTGETISNAGFHVTALAMQLTATLTLGASAAQMGVLVAAEALPNLLFGLLAGVWIDRLRRRPILIVADLGRALVLLSIPVAWWLGILQMRQLYLVIFLIGVGTTFFDVAYLTYLPSLVERDHIIEGNSKMQASSSVMNIVGPNLAGVLVQLFTAPVALLADAGSYVWSAAFIWRIRKAEPPSTRRPPNANMWREIRQGLHALLGNDLLRAVTITGIDFALFNSMRGALSVLYITKELGVSPGVLGAIYGVGGLGALAGALLAGRVAETFGVGPVIVAIYAVFGLFTLFQPAASLAHGPTLLAILMIGQFGAAFCGPIWAVNGNGLRQAITAPGLLGRVNASNRFLYMGGMPIGALAGGFVGEQLGLVPTLTLASIGIIVGSLYLARSPLRRLRALPKEPLTENDQQKE